MILIIDMNWKKDSLGYYEFVLPIVSVAEELDTCTILHYSDVTTAEVGNCDKILFSGTALKDNVTLSQAEKFEWIRNVEKPVLGICAGMQTLGIVLGLRLRKCLEIGMTQITTTRENPLFSDAFKAYSQHNYSLETSSNFEVLAESPNCIQAMRAKDKPVYGVLFHPEVRNPDIIRRFILLKE